MAKRFVRQGGSLTPLVRADQRRLAHYATDKATTVAKALTKAAIVDAGLGRLAGAVGSTSSLRLKGYSQTDNAFGAIYARGATPGRGNQALLAYSEGADIYPGAGKKWLAFPTESVPKRVGRRKMTPALYVASGLETSLGKLHFVSTKNARVALLIAKSVVVSRRTGRILRQQGAKKTRGSDNRNSVVAFILIRYTSRARRFDQGKVMMEALLTIPQFAAEYAASRSD